MKLDITTVGLQVKSHSPHPDGLALRYSISLLMPMNDASCLNLFRKIAFAEGISTVILFFIAMPLKYVAGMPEAVTYVGWVHGVLFIAYVGMLVFAARQLRWQAKRVGIFFLAAWVPFAPFWVERSLKSEPISQDV